MRVLRCKVTLGDYTFDFVTDVSIDTSWDTLTDTCEITIPKKLRYRTSSGEPAGYIVSGTEAVFKRGDKVIVEAGYHPSPEFGELTVYDVIFQGYIVTVEPNKPIKIHCEDEMYRLKELQVGNYTIKAADPEVEGSKDQTMDLIDLLASLLKQANDKLPTADKVYFDLVAESTEIGPLIFEEVTYADALEYLKRTYGLKIYFVRGTESWERELTLYAGFARVTQNADENVLDLPHDTEDVMFGRDIISSDSLVYQNEKDIKIALTCISVDQQNKRISSTVGPSYGAKRNLYFKDLTQKDLDKKAEAMLAEFKYNGYSGNFTMFGVPRLNHGDAVTLKNSDIDDQSGTYLIQKIVRRFGTGGYRQEVSLGPRISKDG